MQTLTEFSLGGSKGDIRTVTVTTHVADVDNKLEASNVVNSKPEEDLDTSQDFETGDMVTVVDNDKELFSGKIINISKDVVTIKDSENEIKDFKLKDVDLKYN